MTTTPACLTAEMCQTLTPRMFVVNHAGGEKLAPEIAQWLDPVQTTSFHCWMLKRENKTALHYHDRDEYWAWVHGRTLLEIRLPDGRSDRVEIGPGWIVYCLRGVEHGHTPLEDWACFEWVGMERPGSRPGHLTRAFNT